MKTFLFILSSLLLSTAFYANAQLIDPQAMNRAFQLTEKYRLLGSPVYIRILKEENVLELFVRKNNRYQLVQTYPICSYSGGLGPKRRQGDFKSPEGFYQVKMQYLNPNSKYYRSFDIGYPNEFDKTHGFTGKYLMVHGDCVSSGCYAMSDMQMDEIYRFVEYAFVGGQQQIEISIFPFRMTPENLQRHRHSVYYDFWKQLKAGYDFFEQNRLPPQMIVVNGRYHLTPKSLASHQSQKGTLATR